MDRLDLETKFQASEAGLMSGYASTFGGKADSYGDVVAPGAYAASLKAHREAGTMPLLLWQHDTMQPVGRWLDIKEDETGLHVTGRLILETVRGAEAYALLKGGALNGLSIGYRVKDSERLPNGGRLLKEIELIEVSLVSIPAASAARITSVKTATVAEQSTDGNTPRKGRIMAEEMKAAAPGAVGMEDRVAAVEDAMGTIDTRLAAVEDAVGAVAKAAGRIEQKLARPGVMTRAEEPADMQKKAFAGFLRSGREALGVDEVKSLRVADDAAGGYLAPADFAAEVIKGIVTFSPVRQAARVGSTASGSVILPKRTGKPTASWVGETEARTETGSTYGQVEIPVHEMAAYVDVSQRLLEDAAVNVEAEVAFDLAEEFGRLEGNALVSGNGAKKPFGFMADTAVSYTPTGNASTLGSAPADTLITLMYAMPAFYRTSGVWMMNGNTLATIRKLKDGQGNFLWQPSYQEGQPETILGRPVIEAPDMADIGSAAEPIVFGDFARAYRIYDRAALSVMRDPYSQATSGLVRFHARRRVGGAVVLSEALRKLRCATA